MNPPYIPQSELMGFPSIEVPSGSTVTLTEEEQVAVAKEALRRKYISDVMGDGWTSTFKESMVAALGAAVGGAVIGYVMRNR